MKIGCTGDWHITDKKPQSRLDENYLRTIIHKIFFILETCKQNEVGLIIQPGDFLDRPSLSYGVYELLWETFNYWLTENNISVFTIYGQHDLYYRSKENTTLSALIFTGVINELHSYAMQVKNVDIYGCGWEEEIPKIAVKSNFNVLAIHRMIIKDKKLWPDQTNFIKAVDLLKQHDFDLIISGDNHRGFADEYKGKHLINCGSLMRSSIDQSNHYPHFWIFDTDTKEMVKFLIPIEPANKILNLEEAAKEKVINENLELFIDGLKKTENQKLNFVEALTDFIKLNHVDEKTQQTVFQFIEREN